MSGPERLRLTLVRHAKSTWRFAQLDDHVRPLNRRGLRDCGRVPDAVGRRVPAPDRVLCSDAARTVQTCEALAPALGIEGKATEFTRELYLADVDRLLGIVRGQPDSVRHLMLVGHNPGLSDLYNCLVPDRIESLPTFAVAHLEVPAPAWAAIEPGTVLVRAYIHPKGL